MKSYVFLVILLGALLSGCSTTYKPYVAYEGSPRPNEEIAILHCKNRCGIIIDSSGTRHDLRPIVGWFSAEVFDPVYLKPGEYKVGIMYWFSLSALKPHRYTLVPVTFEAGHTYRVLDERRCKKWGERSADVWIKDEITDTIVAEQKYNCN